MNDNYPKKEMILPMDFRRDSNLIFITVAKNIYPLAK